MFMLKISLKKSLKKEKKQSIFITFQFLITFFHSLLNFKM